MALPNTEKQARLYIFSTWLHRPEAAVAESVRSFLSNRMGKGTGVAHHNDKASTGRHTPLHQPPHAPDLQNITSRSTHPQLNVCYRRPSGPSIHPPQRKNTSSASSLPSRPQPTCHLLLSNRVLAPGFGVPLGGRLAFCSTPDPVRNASELNVKGKWEEFWVKCRPEQTSNLRNPLSVNTRPTHASSLPFEQRYLLNAQPERRILQVRLMLLSCGLSPRLFLSFS
ncbi:hypothetical protein VTN96DRAFT_9501 [Rasamsonia emersonii]